MAHILTDGLQRSVATAEGCRKNALNSLEMGLIECTVSSLALVAIKK